jgi:DNA-binding PadR family transcriptional regulator
MARATPDDIYLYIYDKVKARTREIQQQFVQTKRMSRGTMYKYLRLLESEGKILTHTVNTRPPYNEYYVPDDHHPDVEALKQYRAYASKAALFNTQHIDWEHCPLGQYLTAVQRKVLWKNEETGAALTLYKVPPGLAEPLHCHPDTNMSGYFLTGEGELPDGTRIPLEGIAGYAVRGEYHMWPKITKETLVICFNDGPHSKMKISRFDQQEEVCIIQDLWKPPL